jgi:1-acyl-sn-glycerol-3-phosphate acyltransferase
VKKPTSKLSFKITAAVINAAIKVIVRLEIRGKENLPPSGPIIAVCNHVHMFDSIIHVINMQPRDSIFLAKEELFHFWPNPFFLFLMKVTESIPVARRGTMDERNAAVQQAQQVLEEGMVLGIYPEGTRSKDGTLNPPHPGAARLALRTGVPLIPVSICGTEKLRGIGWLSRPRVTLTFGKPFYLPPAEGALSFTKLQKLSNFIMEQVRVLLPAEYHGKYGEQDVPKKNDNDKS